MSHQQSLINHNISIKDPETGEEHRTSIRLEKIEWDAMRLICSRKKMNINRYCSLVDFHPLREEHSRTSRIRSGILHYFMNRTAALELAQQKQQEQWQGQEREQGRNKYSPRNLSGRSTIA
ncbi:ribbon-helix-helix domain-containing protein [Sneathiella aquimaris]|uniref:ribbon-helix-helix domain-containing protein n=2 Tax=Sneathiella aquimaris TaxID=2599305 RepID=UPI00146CA5B3